MNTKMNLLAALAFTACFGYAHGQCQGDCTNGYGTLVAGKTTSTGFFKNGKLDGPGDVYGETLYSGQWKDGKKEGFVVYKEADREGVCYGMFVNDLKQGLHVMPQNDGSIIAETFDKGVLKEQHQVVRATDPTCPYGNCQNGIGVKLETLEDGSNMVYTGTFVDGMLTGPGYSLYSGSPNRIFATYQGGLPHGFMVIMHSTGGVELAEMQAGKRHGRLVNIFPDGKSASYVFENGAPVNGGGK